MSKKSKDIFAGLPDFDLPDINENVDQAEVIDIDTEQYDIEAKATAATMIKNFSKLYYDDDFMESQPNLKKRIDVELESLRLLIKMRKCSETTHDLLVRAIGQQSTNASLYKCLSSTQKSLMDIQTKMDETLKHLGDMLKNIQLEFNFAKEQAEGQPKTEDMSNVSRGSKEYIEKLRKENEMS